MAQAVKTRAPAAKPDVNEPDQRSNKPLDDRSKAEAKGFQIAQSVIAVVRSHADELGKLARQLVEESDVVRDACTGFMQDWKKRLTTNVKATRPGSMNEKQSGAVARSAVVRVSQMQTIIKACRGAEKFVGLTKEEILRQAQIIDSKGNARTKKTTVEWDDVKFDLLVKIAQLYTASSAGRPAKAAFVKLLDYSRKLKALNDDDNEALSASIRAMADIAKKFGIEVEEAGRELPPATL